jgi:glycosyltransferase involved in cell wall biosynthesis
LSNEGGTLVLSVIIPALNAEQFLGEQLEALARQEAGFEWEVILADNGSTDGTVVLFERIAPRLRSARVVDASEHPGQAFARNAGVGAARGECLVFLDADDVAAPGYLAAMADALATHPIAVARMDMDTLNDEPARIAWPEEHGDGVVVVHLGFLPAGAGGCLAVRRELFDRLGGFDVALPPAEDIDFCWRAQLEAGATLGVASGAILRYRYRRTVRGVFRQAFKYGSVQPALYRRYRAAGMQRRRGVAAARFYGGVVRRALGVRSRADLADLAALVGTRVGHLAGSARYGVWYP